MTKAKQKLIDTPLSSETVADFREWLQAQSQAELISKVTTYEPGTPHLWHGETVLPVTEQELHNTQRANRQTLKTG
jgi:hypothetical protein